MLAQCGGWQGVPVHQYGDPKVKKILTAFLALTVIAGVAAPVVAAETATEDCRFINKSMCEAPRSLLDTSEE